MARRLIARLSGVVGVSKCGRRQLGQAEIEHLHKTVGAHDDVFWLDVSMDDSLLVGGRERGGHGVNDAEGLVNREWQAGQPLAQVSPTTYSIAMEWRPSVVSPSP